MKCPFCGESDAVIPAWETPEEFRADRIPAYRGCCRCSRMTRMKTIRELIEKCRESDERRLADTLDLIWENPMEPDKWADGRLTGSESLYFRSGVILGVEHERRGTERENPERRENFISSLRERGMGRLADAVDYCWYNPDTFESGDFDYDGIPLEDGQLTLFSVGCAFGVAFEREYPDSPAFAPS